MRNTSGGEVMKRIGRYIFNALTVLSLLLCVATAGLWVRSYHNEDCLIHISNSDEVTDKCLYSSLGRMTCLAVTFFITTPDGAHEATGFRWQTKKHSPGLFNRTTIHSVRDFGAQPGFVWRNFEFTNRDPFRPLITVPHWALVMLLAFLPSWGLIRHAGHGKSRVAGICPQCGYDLGATPDRCPECGAVSDKVKA
jgi:hypothetical protein